MGSEKKRRPLEDSIKPTDLLHFVELRQFTRRWHSLGLDDEADLWTLQVMIMTDPKAGDVIKGTDGLRKLRFAPPRWEIGKSGAARVLYVYFEEFFLVLLCVVYGKSEQSNIAEATKQQVNTLIRVIAKQLKNRSRIE